MPVYLPEECAAWTAGRWCHHPPRPITAVAHDTRAMPPGALYVALRGDRFDGHAFVEEAFKCGACAAMVEDGYDGPGRDGPLLEVADTRRALVDLARHHRQRCRAHIIAITGSVGKTTVKEMLVAILSQCGRVTGTVGNWNNDIGVPLSLLRMDPRDDFGVFEVAMNRPGEITALCSIVRPDWGLMTPVGLAHGEKFSGIEDIAREKSSLIRSLPSNGLAILSADEDWFDLFRDAASCRVVTVALDGVADYTGSDMQEYPAELKVTEPSGASFLYALPLLGRHILRDALLAVAAAREAGASPTAMAAVLARYRPPPMHWHCVEIGGVQFINDAYNASPLSMRAALQTFVQTPVQGRRWLVLAGMHELGASAQNAHEQIGALAAQSADILITVGPFGTWMADGARQAGMSRAMVRECAEPGDAAAMLAAEAKEGEAVLVKASRAERLENVMDLFAELLAGKRQP